VTQAPAALGGGPVLLRQRCDPYGRETRVKLMGGLYPERRASALALEMGFCPRVADAVYRMVCECGHRGQPMPLCGPGLVQDARGEWYPHPGHVASIQRRQAGLCPACAFPPEARELGEAMEARQADAHNAMRSGYLGAAAQLGQAVERMREQMTELYERGIIHRCPLQLVEVS
jgi:hypothetical protein